MNSKIYTSILLLSVLLAMCSSISAIRCLPNACDTVKCRDPGVCDGPKQVIEKGGFCGCCPSCHTVLQENDECKRPLLGASYPSVYCGAGLVCKDNICTKL